MILRKMNFSVVRLYYGFQLFFSLLLWVPIFYVLQKNAGLTDVEIYKIQSLYYLAFCLFELPTGRIADSIGSKKCLLLGSVSLIIANLLPIIFSNYHGFLIHFLLVALARSFVSGAASAYLYDYLLTTNKISDYKLIEGRARSLSLIGRVVTWPLVGMLMG